MPTLCRPENWLKKYTGMKYSWKEAGTENRIWRGGGGREIGNSKLRKDRRFGLWIMDGRKIKNITSILRKKDTRAPYEWYILSVIVWISPPAGEQKARQAFYFGFIKTTTLSTLHLPSSNSRWPGQWSVTAHHFTAGKAKSSKLGYGTLQLRRTR